MRLLKHLEHKRIACDVDEELRFHVEMLQQKYARHGMSPVDAKAAAQKRFGNFERVKNQCVKISRRSSPLHLVLKISSILLAFTGLLIFLLNSDYKVARIGTLLIVIAILGRVLLYVRGFSPSTPLNQRSITIHNAKR
jgi:hypothetical protein